MKIFDIFKYYPIVTSIINIIKNADLDKNKETTLAEWLLVALEIAPLFVKFNASQEKIIKIFKKFIEDNQADLLKALKK